MLPKIPTLITDLQKQTVTQLKATLTAGMTKRDLLIIANGSDKINDEPVRVYGKGYQILSEKQVTRDVETNAIINTKTITWTYYPKGETDEITITENGKKKIIKHYLDRQPTVTETVIK